MRKAFAILAGSVAFMSASLSQAAVLFDSGGFEGYSNGTLIGQNGWQRDSSVTGAGSNSQFTVGGTTNKFVTLSGANAANTQYAFPSIEYTPVAGSGELVSVSVDLAASDPNLSAPDNTGYYVDMYSDVARIGRFGFAISANTIKIAVVSWFNTTTGQFVPAQAATSSTVNIFNVTVSAALTANSFYNLEARINFDTKTYDIFNNNVLFVGNLAFAATTTTNATQVTLADADVTVTSVAGAGATNTGFVDNYVVSTIPAAIPEPTALAAIVPAGLLLSRRRR